MNVTVSLLRGGEGSRRRLLISCRVRGTVRSQKLITRRTNSNLCMYIRW